MSLQWLIGAAWALSVPEVETVVPQPELPAVVGTEPSVAPVSALVVSESADEVLPIERDIKDSPRAVTERLEKLPPPPESLEPLPVLPEAVPAKLPDADRWPGPKSAVAFEEPRVVGPTPKPNGNRRKVRWIGPLGITGIVVGAVGLGGVAASGVLLTRGRTVEVDPADRTKLVLTDYDRPGWVFYGVGLAVTTVGASALAIDVTVGRDRRARRVRLQPQVGRAQAGLALRGSF